MKAYTLALLSLVGNAAAQGVTAQISPSASAPASCEPTLGSNFEIAILSMKTKRDVALKNRATCSGNGVLVAALSDGVIKDSKGRTGYIASNFQFQFDEPPQAGAIYTAGFSVCSNSSLALGGSTVWYKCQSGDFYNLYDRSWATQCSPVEIAVMPCDGTDPPGGAGQIGDGQVIGTQVITTTVVVPISDGQPQVRTTTVPIPMCQISDGQLQAHTTPCASITTIVSASASTTAAPVSQYSDGQIQVTPATGGTTAPAPASARTTSGSTVVVPTLTVPTATGSASIIGSNTTLSTTASPTAPVTGTAGASASTSRTTSAPASGAGHVEMGSIAALVVGVFAAVWGL